jgi:hypothetical protein
MARQTAPTISRLVHATWLLFGGLFTGLAVAACAVGAWIMADGTGPVMTRTEQQAYPNAAARIEVFVEQGDLRVIGGASQVSVQRNFEFVTRMPTVTETWNGDTLTIGVQCELGELDRMRGDSCWVGFVLRVPTTVAVEADIGSGAIRVQDVDGDLRLSTRSGSIDVRNAKGRIWARSDSGDVTATGLRGAEADARATFGQVSLQFDLPPGLARGVTDFGDVEIAVPRGDNEVAPYAVRISAPDGQAYVDVQSDPGSTHQLMATSERGDVFIRYSSR